MFHWLISCNLMLLLQLLYFDSAQVGVYVYIPHHCKYQIKPHWSPQFSAACTAAIGHINHFSHLYQKKIKCDKVKFRVVSNHCKSILEASKPAHANEKRVSLHRNLALITCRIANSVFNKNLQYFFCLCVSGCCLPHQRRSRCFAEIFSKNSNVDDSGMYLPVFSFRINMRLHNVPVTLDLVKKVIIDLDFSKRICPWFYFSVGSGEL